MLYLQSLPTETLGTGGTRGGPTAPSLYGAGCTFSGGDGGVLLPRGGRSQGDSRGNGGSPGQVRSRQSVQASEATTGRMYECDLARPTAKMRGDWVHQVWLRRLPGHAKGAHNTRRLVAYVCPRFPTLEWMKAWGPVRPRTVDGQSDWAGCKFTYTQCYSIVSHVS